MPEVRRSSGWVTLPGVPVLQHMSDEHSAAPDPESIPEPATPDPPKKKKSKAGRKSKLTPELHDQIMEMIRSGQSKSKTAWYLGIGVSTFEHWLERGAMADSPKIYRKFLWDYRKAVAYFSERNIAIIQKH